eukprot:TRINITY_DN70045_c0_g1_i1.p2 TRINITY_DN70045_c0_g1~~TRINITY_DN70045_c0_g1_i1.p2  ORF type:complete len:113 (+),score=14.64 TRINITY_DN70045_c0_g1_i1:23-361(+)
MAAFHRAAPSYDLFYQRGALGPQPVFNMGTFTQGQWLHKQLPQAPVAPTLFVVAPPQTVYVDFNLPGSFRTAEIPTALRKDLLHYMSRSVTPGTRGTLNVGPRGESITFHRL